MKRAAILVAATLTAGSVSFFLPAPWLAADVNPNAPTTAPSTALGKTGQYPDNSVRVGEGEIRDFLAKVTVDAVNQHSLDQVCTHFTDDDSRRIGESRTFTDNYGNELDKKIDFLRREWHRVYGDDFPGSVDRHALGEKFASITRGVYGQDPTLAAQVCNLDAQAAGEEIVPNSTNTNNVNTPSDQAAANNPRTFANDEDIALVHVVANDNLPEAKVALARKSGTMDWKILAPRSMDAEQVRKALSRELTDFSQSIDQWPADENVAFRQLSHRILMALGTTYSPA